jgi:hypothetical protein
MPIIGLPLLTKKDGFEACLQQIRAKIARWGFRRGKSYLADVLLELIYCSGFAAGAL